MVDVAANDVLDAVAEAGSVAELSPSSMGPADSCVSEQTEVHSEGVNGGFAAEEEAAGITANGVANGGVHDEPESAVAADSAADPEVNEAAAAKSGAETEEEAPPEEEKWRKQLWFVRMPKPPEDTAVLALDQEFESLRVQHNLLSETMTVKKLEKDAAISNLRNAQDAVNRCIEALRAKDEQLLPLKQLRAARKTLAEDLASYKDLPVKSEIEIDRRVAEANHNIEHSSLTLNEEKALLKEVKKLSASRDRIKEYTIKNSQMEELKAQIRAMEASLEGVEADCRALRSELQVAKVVRDKFKEEERGVAASMSEVYAERAQIKEVKDAAYNRMAERKSGTRAKVTDFYENRRFSRRVRQLLAEGKLEEARDLCAEQQEEAHAKLNTDDAYRAEYFKLWGQQRVPTFDFSPEEPEEVLARKGAKAPKKATTALDPEVARRNADAIIAAAMAEVSLQVKSAPAAAAAAKEPDPVPEPLPVPAAAPLPAAKPKATKAAGAPLVVVPEASLPAALQQDDKFQLPDFAKQAAKSTAAKSTTSKEREQQQSRDAREKAAEAEARKERRRKAAERRREKAAEVAKVKDAEARVTAEAVAATAAAATVAASAVSDGDSEPAAAEAPVVAPAVKSSQPAKRSGGGNGKAGAKAAAAATRNAVRARPPAPKKKGFKAWLKQYEMYLIGAALVLFVLTMLHFSFSR